MTAAVVTGVASALPATFDQDAVWDGYFARHYEGVGAARRIFASAGVRRRHAVANPMDADISGWGTGARMVRYVQEALPLGKQAVAGALDVAHALFSDAAAAVVLEPGAARGRRLAGVVARTDASTADHMTWDVTDLGFRMGLSPRVPDVLSRHVGGVVEELLGGAGLRMEDVAGWAVHPGGPRILDVVRDELGLTEEQMATSRRVLAEHGNCSSATVLLVLEEMADVAGPVVVMAFGPGLTLYAALLLPA